MSIRLEETLLSTRDDYQREAVRHRFLLDAYAGTGGFQGRERMAFSGFWGWASEQYSRSNLLLDASYDSDAGLETYLDRFHREDTSKFKRRIGIAHYPNYIAPSVDVPLSFMFRKPLTRSPEPENLGLLNDFLENANGAGMSWQDMLRDVIAVRAAVVGWCPVLFDIFGEDAEPGMRLRTALDDMVEGRRPVAIPLFPANLLDWQADETGTLQWVKIRQQRSERTSPLEPAKDIVRVTVWTRSTWQWWDMAKGPRGGGKLKVFEAKDGPNPFGEVPVRVMRRKPIPDDPFRGVPIAGDASNEARRLFNALSELDEHMRNCAYALLQIPTKTPNKLASLVGGNGNAVPIDPDSQRDYKWLTPDTSISTMYEKRIESIIEEIFRMQHMEFTRGTKGGGARSGVSQAFEFEAANRNIANFARQMALFDEGCVRLVAKGYGRGVPASETIKTTSATRFDVQEMSNVLEEAMSAIRMDIGPTAEAELKKRLVAQLLPNVTAEMMQTINDEIQDMGDAKREMMEQARANLENAANGIGDDDGEDDDGDGADGGDGGDE